MAGKLILLSANFTKWSNTLKQVVGKLPTNCLSVFDQFVKLVLKGLKKTKIKLEMITDIDMLQRLEKGIRGGICNTLHQYAKTNNII